MKKWLSNNREHPTNTKKDVLKNSKYHNRNNKGPIDRQDLIIQFIFQIYVLVQILKSLNVFLNKLGMMKNDRTGNSGTSEKYQNTKINQKPPETMKEKVKNKQIWILTILN